MNDNEIVPMSDEDATAINQRIDEAARRVARTVKRIRETGDMQFRGNIAEMLAVLVVLRYLDEEEGNFMDTTVTLREDATP